MLRSMLIYPWTQVQSLSSSSIDLFNLWRVSILLSSDDLLSSYFSFLIFNLRISLIFFNFFALLWSYIMMKGSYLLYKSITEGRAWCFSWRASNKLNVIDHHCCKRLPASIRVSSSLQKANLTYFSPMETFLES